MMNGGILTLAFGIVVLLILHECNGQFPPQDPYKWRNPRIERYFRYICRNTQCMGFEDVCEIRPTLCFSPPCPDEPTCVVTPGSSTKLGRCPQPYRIWARRPRCNTDYGCYNSEVCCHGFWGSECRPPLLMN